MCVRVREYWGKGPGIGGAQSGAYEYIYTYIYIYTYFLFKGSLSFVSLDRRLGRADIATEADTLFGNLVKPCL